MFLEFVTSNLVLHAVPCLTSAMTCKMQRSLGIALSLVLFAAATAGAVTKPHVITFGKWTTVQWSPTARADDKTPTPPLTLKVRPLLVDARVKEFTLGATHDVTDRLFVVRRAFRINDSLPQEPALPQHWQWQPGGWLMVDRTTGRVSLLNLPEFDAFYSAASWYRDYAAYCGVSEDGKKVFAVVAQISRRKPIVNWLMGEVKADSDTPQGQIPDSPCKVPEWQRSPARVTFEATSTKRTYVIRGHSVDLATSEDEDEEAAK
jgi:hypothetical protein